MLVEDDPENEEGFLRGIREKGDDLRGFVLETPRDGVDVRTGKP